ncbi:MAG: DUF192 domain-containing protein [Inhella sp.]|jgi:uncharacterized membrane protein (UPF0127 family)|uniref:DUF192 domain-containing protein n=1 Tax=Inhella sp. TaxID=1921806 RepID=UPI0022C0054D|nr:DUF192 domain-containing protein [Inhella sp.]MCZ8233823.1 DUF192 domain-containing protein [Inhella sp.]
MTHIKPWVLFLSLALAGSVGAQSPQRLPTVPLRAGMFQIQAQVAQSPEQRAIGLMHRKSMPAHEGMLFVFESREVQCFWMKNTHLPLSIAFVADDGRIVSMADMQPMDETSHCSKEPVRYALEMNQGWFAQKGIKPGSRLSGAPFSASQ